MPPGEPGLPSLNCTPLPLDLERGLKYFRKTELAKKNDKKFPQRREYIVPGSFSTFTTDRTDQSNGF
jgi:hypothetical protein